MGRSLFALFQNRFSISVLISVSLSLSLSIYHHCFYFISEDLHLAVSSNEISSWKLRPEKHGSGLLALLEHFQGLATISVSFTDIYLYLELIMSLVGHDFGYNILVLDNIER